MPFGEKECDGRQVSVFCPNVLARRISYFLGFGEKGSDR